MKKTLHLIPHVLAGVVVSSYAAQVRAQDNDAYRSARPSAEVVDQSLKDGAFLPLSMGTASHPHQSAAVAWAGYARGGASVDARAEGLLLPWLTLQMRASADQEISGWRPSAGVRARILRESDSRPGLALAAFYKAEGFTEPEGELEAVLALSKHVGEAGFLINLAYGQDAEGRERDGEAGGAVTLDLRERWLVGVDARARLNLAPAASQGAGGEPRFDIAAGPLIMCRLGPTFLAAQVGISVVSWNDTRTGALGLLGIGAAL